ncbi:DUF4124 domain-containing protein [Massilia sp. IC2-278]|uniref:DUF4124 domain-containing protein n=1 Tax=Massilia sp. IC2-278 TaxID=2887200 RepID=UPI001E3601EF|nr:DUF4124 domain-containing protein [Massilia sp. IC2-278]MCC2962715.1 DUF4124 domain-containing protein [Massilia sp. IC2-278]
MLPVMPSLASSSPALLLRRAAAVALLFAAGLAQAQFVWVDPKGVRHYSDQPPPPGTPPARILKAPGLPAISVQPAAPALAVRSAPPSTPLAPANPINPASPATASTPADPAAAAGAKPGAKAPQTLAEKDADFRKRLKEGQENELKAQEQARIAAQKTEHCGEVRRAKQMLDSGIRIADVGADGQKRYLNDAERAQRSARANAMAAECR